MVCWKEWKGGIVKEGRRACISMQGGGEETLEDGLRKAAEVRGVDHFGWRGAKIYGGGGLHATMNCTPVSRRILQGVQWVVAPHGF